VAQQREANNINMSLMNLWRCLQSMRKKQGEANDIIPFRESKLTHLLMPQLCRAGASCVAMIACINPQADDYDETLSVLNNASIACKIKEIADLGRLAALPMTNASRSSDAVSDDNLPVVAGAAMNEVTAGTVSSLVAAIQKSSSFKTKVDTKKRKHDSMLSGTHTRKNSSIAESKFKNSLPLFAAP
jgi:hypothetical protein